MHLDVQPPGGENPKGKKEISHDLASTAIVTIDGFLVGGFEIYEEDEPSQGQIHHWFS